MSGAISTAVGAVSGIAAIAGIFGGGQSPLILGNFQFNNFEVPQTIAFGGKNDITVHKLGGDQKVFDVMGTNENDMSWSGILLSSDAQVRATTLETMRMAGQVIPFSFGAFYYSVIIEDVDFVYHQPNHINYSIKVVVVNSKQPSAQTQSLLSQITADIALAAYVLSEGLDDIAVLSPASAAVLPLSVAIGATSVVSAGNSATLALATTALASQAALGAVANTVQGNLAAQVSGPAVGGGQAAAAYVTSIAQTTQQASVVNQAQNLVGRTVNNIT